jgi:hypothetical protein
VNSRGRCGQVSVACIAFRVRIILRDEQLAIQIPAFEIIEPGLGLLSEQNPLADRPISFERSPRIFFMVT